MKTFPSSWRRGTSLLALGAVLAAGLAAADRPNIVLILADDLGYGDIAAYQPQSKIPTPHLDRLAARGIRFTDAHTPSSVCTPTRYGLLTGRYAWRTWLKTGVLDGFDPPLLEEGRETLASFLRAKGYATAVIGKWHLGMTWTARDGRPVAYRGATGFRSGAEVDYAQDTRGGPLDRGFGTFFGLSASLDMSPYAFIEGRRVGTLPTVATPEDKTLLLNQVAGMQAPDFALEAVLPTLNRRAVQFIRSEAGKSDPFFLYVPLPSPHLPVVPNREWVGKSGAGSYGDFVAETDGAVGEILAALDETGQRDRTLVLFTSDNGGLWHTWEAVETDDRAGYKPTARALYTAERGHRSNAGLRGTKADIYEGGHRVPFLASWPARLPAGRVSDALVQLNDVFATVAEILGTSLPADVAEDSFSFLAALRGGAPAAGWPARTVGVHHSLHGVFAVREGPWKFVPTRGSGGFSSPRQVAPKAGEPQGQLYNLAADPAETTNRWADEPERVKRMAATLEQIRADTRTRP
jgi:arylsulfatase A